MLLGGSPKYIQKISADGWLKYSPRKNIRVAIQKIFPTKDPLKTK